ncbi:MAG: multiheme c-type cytochrome [Thiohalomonadaceae bacterium]
MICLRSVLLLLCSFLLLACSDKPPEDPVATFLARHWADPLPAQGAPPPGYTAIEADLNPEACAQCHEAQWQQWRTSLHAHTMGASIQWQLHLLDQKQGNSCLRCHAPLAEQKALVAIQQDWPAAPTSAIPDYVPDNLAESGLSCAACHVREHQRYGPPAQKEVSADPLPHGGFTVSTAFADSRFCATCHQFPEDGPRVNGKLQEDTYAQWAASPYKDKQHCQSCHMPERQHLFRGIHDREMVLQALAVEMEFMPGRNENELGVRVVLRNQGAGHHFPTYMVPKVTAVLELLDEQGRRVSELTRYVIGWGVDVRLTEEYFDTRIPAGGERELQVFFRQPAAVGWQLELRLEVVPGEHYERTFKDSLRHASVLEPKVLALLQQALAETQAKRFIALQRRMALPGLDVSSGHEQKP